MEQLPMNPEIRIDNPGQLDPAAEQLLAAAGDRRIFAFTGEIGAGKTTFIKALCRRLGVSDEVTSPTFALVNEYACSPDSNGVVYHLDLYRLKNLEEALDIGIEDILDSGAYCFIEWPELIEPLLPDDVVHINIEIVGNSTRKILFL